MKKLIAAVGVLVLTSTAALAQYTTECTPGLWGNITCNTTPSDPFYYFHQQQHQQQQQLYQQQQQQLGLEQIRIRWAIIRQQCRGTWSEDFSLDPSTYTGSGKCWNN